MFSIYIIKNQVNGKVYIGKTSKSPSQRLRQHFNESQRLQNRHLAKAIRKHGPENFVIETIRVTEEEKEANWLESLYIGITRSTSHTFGYNDTFGGEGVVGTPETNAKISAALKGRSCSAAHRAKLRKARKGRTPALGMRHTDDWKIQHSFRMTGKGHPLFGKRHSKASKRKMSLARKGKFFPQIDIPILEISDLYAKGYSTRQIAKMYSVEKTTIIRRLKRAGIKLRPALTPKEK